MTWKLFINPLPCKMFSDLDTNSYIKYNRVKKRKCSKPAFSVLFPTKVFDQFKGKLWSCRCFNPFPHKAWFLHVCSSSLLKTLQQAWYFLFQILYFFLDVNRVWNGNQLACETQCGLIGYKNKPLQSRNQHICHFIWQSKHDITHVVKKATKGASFCALFHSSFIMFVLCCCTCMLFPLRISV